MDRRLLFPAVAAVAWAQQTSPATAEAEKALRARAEQFYQLEVAHDFRHAEAFVAEDTKDLYYNNGKPDIRKFTIDKVEFTDPTHAKVTANVTSRVIAPRLGAMEFTAPVPTIWKIDNGEWCWYQIQDGDIDTPFGKWHVGTAEKGSPEAAPPMPQGMITDPSKLASLVTIDRTSVDIVSGDSRPATVTISNHMSGSISVKLTSPKLDGLLVSIDKENLRPNDSAVVSFRASGAAHPSGTVHISAGPLQDFAVQVASR